MLGVMSDISSDQEHDFLIALGSEVRSQRLLRHMSREELAARTGVSATTIGRIERANDNAGARTIDTWRIAKILGVNLTDLVRRAEESADWKTLAKNSSDSANAEGQVLQFPTRKAVVTDDGWDDAWQEMAARHGDEAIKHLNEGNDLETP